MDTDNAETIADWEEKFDDPYVHTGSTDEFAETVEQASQEEDDEALVPHRDKFLSGLLSV